jgi:hypothetical protein
LTDCGYCTVLHTRPGISGAAFFFLPRVWNTRPSTGAEFCVDTAYCSHRTRKRTGSAALQKKKNNNNKREKISVFPDDKNLQSMLSFVPQNHLLYVFLPTTLLSPRRGQLWNTSLSLCDVAHVVVHLWACSFTCELGVIRRRMAICARQSCICAGSILKFCMRV